jgi:hypothetical protein
LSALVLITKYKEIPISINKKVHTGPKSQDGGLKKGLLRLRNQLETEFWVKNEPKTPVSKLTPRENRSNVILFFILIL